MNDLSPMSDLIADDLFLDRLAGRVDAGSEPLAGLLGALAAQADTPLPSRTSRRRIANKHRYFGAFAALAVAASGAGVAAAVTLPSNGPSQAERARIIRMMDDSARSDASSALLTRLGLPQTSGTRQARGLVLARRDDGTIVLLPAAMVAAQRGAAGAVLPGIALDGRVGTAQPGNGQGGRAATGNGQGNGQTGAVGSEAGGTTGQDGDQGDSADQGGGAQTGTPQTTSTGKKPTPDTPGTKGGKKPTPTSTPSATLTSTPTGTPSPEAVAPQTTLAPLTTTTSKARSTGVSPTSPPRGSRTPAPRPSTGAVGTAAASVTGVFDTLADGVVPSAPTTGDPAS